MAKSQETFNKKEKEKKRLKKREEKQKKKEERKANNSKGGSLDDMIAYVDYFGNITDTPPDPSQKIVVNAENIEIGVPKREEDNSDPVHNGIVEFFNDSKGYGFIKDLGNQETYFVHVNGLVDEIKEKDKVTFELERGMKGMNAIKVTKI